MADLQFEGSHDEQWGQIKAAVIDLHSLVKGNGKDGLVKEVSDIQRSLATIEAYGKASTVWTKALAGLITVLFGALGIYIAIKEHDGAKSGLTLDQTPTLAVQSHQDAGNPPGYVGK